MHEHSKSFATIWTTFFEELLAVHRENQRNSFPFMYVLFYDVSCASGFSILFKGVNFLLSDRVQVGSIQNCVHIAVWA